MSSHLWLGLPSCLFKFPHLNPVCVSIPPVHATCPTHLKYFFMQFSPVSCYFVPHRTVFFSTLFSDSLNLCTSVFETKSHTHPNNKPIVLNVVMYMLMIIHAYVNYVAELDTGRWGSTGNWHLLFSTKWHCTKQWR